MSQIFSDFFWQKVDDAIFHEQVGVITQALGAVESGCTWYIAGDEQGPNLVVLVMPARARRDVELSLLSYGNQAEAFSKIVDLVEQSVGARKIKFAVEPTCIEHTMIAELPGVSLVGTARSDALIRGVASDMVLYERLHPSLVTVEPEVFEEFDLDGPQVTEAEPAPVVAETSEPVTQSEGPTVFGDNAEDQEREKRLIRVFG
jgi:hypothetical protein